MDLAGLGLGLVAGSSENGNEALGSVILI